MGGSKKTKSGSGLGWIIFPLLGINIYAGWLLTRAAEHFGVKLFESPTHSLTQLAAILGINMLAIIVMALFKP